MKKLLLFVIFAAAAVFGYRWYFAPEKVIQRRTQALIDCFQYKNTDGDEMAMQLTKNLSGLLAKKVAIQYPKSDLGAFYHIGRLPVEKQLLTRGFRSLISSSDSLSTKLSDYQLVNIADSTATVKGKVSYKLKSMVTDQKGTLNMALEYTKGSTWQISSIELSK